jgi:hypothetical protein
MNIKKAQNIIDPAISRLINQLKEDGIEIKITMLRSIINESINKNLNISYTDSLHIKSMFSGRGKAWAKVFISQDNPVWEKILESFTINNIDSFYETNVIDLFKETGFAWIRFGSSSKGETTFHLRYRGSKSEDHLKIKVNDNDITEEYLVNLEGVPHRLNLEEGYYDKSDFSKRVINNDKEVSKEELSIFNITSLDEILQS